MTNTSTFSGKIIQKFMTAEEFGKFVEKYMAHKSFTYTPRAVNDNDREIFKDYTKGGMDIKALAKKYGISNSKVMTAIVKASKEV